MNLIAVSREMENERGNETSIYFRIYVSGEWFRVPRARSDNEMSKEYRRRE